MNLTPYDRDNYPTYFERFTAATLMVLENLRARGARAAAEDRHCDHVELSEFSEGETKGSFDVAVFVQCANGFRIYYNAGGVIRTESIPGYAR